MDPLKEYALEVLETIQERVGNEGATSLVPAEGGEPKDVLFAVLSMGKFADDDLTSFCVALGHIMFGYAKHVALTTFWRDIRRQLDADQVRWGDTWRNRSVRGQQERTMARVRDYYDQLNLGTSQDVGTLYLKAAGNLYICIVRLLHPDYATA